MHSKAIFTICSANYLPFAKVLFDSLKKYAPEWDFFLVLVERKVEELSYEDELSAHLSAKILWVEDLDIPQFRAMAFQYSVMELNTAVKPFAFQYLFGLHEKVVYFDPDIRIFAPLHDLAEWLDKNECLVTPHLSKPLPQDGCFPTNENMIRCGQFNFGFVAFKATVAVKEFIFWWSDRLTKNCIFHSNHYYFVDQFYGAMVASFLKKLFIIHHQGYNLAYWNLPQRVIGLEEGAFVTTDGPLVFFHFSGLPEDLSQLSRYQNRMILEPGSACYQLLTSYRADFEQNQLILAPFVKPYTYACYDDGMPILDYDRRAFLLMDRDDTESLYGEDPFLSGTRRMLRQFETKIDFALDSDGLFLQLRKSDKEKMLLEREMDFLRGVNKALTDERDTLRTWVASPSMKLGRALTWPVRFLREAIF